MASSCRGYSKAQTCFFKILRIISSTPPSKQEQPFPTNTKGIGIDLNLRFSSAAESGDSESSRTDGAFATAQPNNNDGEEEEEETLREKSVEVSEKLDNNNEVVNDVETESEEDGNENENAETASFEGRDSNCLDLLIEAARVISGKDALKSRGEKRKERWVVVDLYGGDVVEERKPVVRSKRGRNQALPHRFRDSVVEPFKRATRSPRPSSTAHLSKRLLRSSSAT